MATDEATNIEVTDGDTVTDATNVPTDNRLCERELMTLHAGAVRNAYGLMDSIAAKANDQNGEILVRLTEAFVSLYNAVSDTVEVSTATTLHDAFFAPVVSAPAVSDPKGAEGTDSDLDPSDTGEPKETKPHTGRKGR